MLENVQRNCHRAYALGRRLEWKQCHATCPSGCAAILARGDLR
jgi:hypothetical protein